MAKQPKPAKSNLLDKILKNSNSDMASILSESAFFNKSDFVTTEFPILNLAFSGSIKGGFTGGLITIAGPSRHFKSSFGLAAIKAFQQKNPEGIVIFYDSEGGITSDYLKTHGIDTDKVVYDFVTTFNQIPCMNASFNEKQFLLTGFRKIGELTCAIKYFFY